MATTPLESPSVSTTPTIIDATNPTARPFTAETAVNPTPDLEKGVSPEDHARLDKEEASGDNSSEAPQPVDSKPSTEDPYLVKIGPDDPRHPFSWSVSHRWVATLIGGLLTLNSTFASSAPSGNIIQTAKEFSLSTEVGTLLISLFVAGYCVGPLLWGPLSETIGRKLVLLMAFTPYMLFQIGCALAPNIGALLAFRFLSGMFASAPLSVAGALMADLWDARKRAIGMGIFALAPFAGPSLGPLCAGFMEVRHVDWRWIYWVTTIFAGLCLILVLIFLPETYVPYLEKKAAVKLRKETGDPKYYSATEMNRKSFGTTAAIILGKPFKMFFQEPLLVAVTIYMSFVYGCLYLLFEAFPIIYVEHHGFNMGELGLTFLPITIGGAIGTSIYIFYINPRYERYLDEHYPNRPPAEIRLEMAMIGGPCLVVGFFWIGWTAYPSINPASPIIATTLIGVALLTVFLPLMNYLVDVYLMHAASALSANAVVRSAFGAGFPLFATQMFNKLGVPWACSLLGFVSLALAPIPFLFYRYGHTLRKMSKFAPT